MDNLEIGTDNNEHILTVCGVTRLGENNYISVAIERFDGTTTAESFFTGEIMCIENFISDNIISDNEDILNSIAEYVKPHILLDIIDKE